MSNQRLSDIIKSATEVNLRYSANLLNLSKDYIKSFTQSLANEEAREVDEKATAPKTGAKTVPLIIAGRMGETANAAFVVNNTSNMGGSVSLQVSGDFADSLVTVEPEILSLKNGEGAIIRILVTIGKQMLDGVDHHGTVLIPELGITIAEFVIHKLPDSPPKKKTTRKRSPSEKS